MPLPYAADQYNDRALQALQVGLAHITTQEWRLRVAGDCQVRVIAGPKQGVAGAPGR